MRTDKSLFVIVVGCGRLGVYLADRLSHEGHSVVVVDSDHAAFANLSTEYSGFKVEGDATELGVLKQAKISEADIVVGATHNDNVNLMIAQIARKIFNVPKVMARIFEPQREELCHTLGIATICPTTLAGDGILASVRGSSAPAPRES
ncbi:MAG: TrkA family potassium uptake protein [Sedimentisphaerales bacterium]|nr:TrkA family potassium uptake protein [Sedimentisphaerales bacterium]